MKGAQTVPVLMYHHVSPSDGMITTSPDNFERQLAWLRRHGYRSLTSDGFAGHLAGDPTPPKSILITFDDGYLDNWVYAYPLLKRYGFNAMVFLVTSWIGEGLARPCFGNGDLPETPSHRECEARIQRGARDEVMLRWDEIKA
ncbi:MAG: polysaccharide deacetylase family protein, partial [Burkholderiaceae bacterium]